ncbi:MAG: recombination-associated protein RdgC [Desulfatiglandaceae bacterium]
MGIISGSGSFTRYMTKGPLPEDFLEDLSFKVGRRAFRHLDEKSVDERSAGWVNIMDMFDNRFEGLEFLKEPYVAMTLRIDERKIPSTAVKQYCIEAEEKIKAEEELEYLPKQRRLDIKEAVRLRLLKRAIPVSKTYDMIWNYTTGLVIFGSLNAKVCDEFAEIFLQTFDIHLEAVCPHFLAQNRVQQTHVSADRLDQLTPWHFAEETPNATAG